jgi:hypothetical protein
MSVLMRKSSKGGTILQFPPLSLYSLYSLELQLQYRRGFAVRLRDTSNTKIAIKKVSGGAFRVSLFNRFQGYLR